MFWHSGVSGAPCSGPQDLVWSNDGWPRTPGKTARFHWPLRFGYFASGVWAPAVDTSKTANAKAPSKLRQCMIVISSSQYATDHFGGSKPLERQRSAMP